MFPNNNPIEHITYPNVCSHILVYENYACHFEFHEMFIRIIQPTLYCAETLIKCKAIWQQKVLLVLLLGVCVIWHHINLVHQIAVIHQLVSTD
jgi:hypothetical protein